MSCFGLHCWRISDCMCRAAEERLKSCDDAFREQLEAKQRAHDSHVIQLTREKNQEVEQANQKVGISPTKVTWQSHDLSSKQSNQKLGISLIILITTSGAHCGGRNARIVGRNGKGKEEHGDQI